MYGGLTERSSAGLARLLLLIVLIIILAAIGVVMFVKVDDIVVAQGMVRPDSEVEVRSVLRGTIEKVHVEPGAQVSTGTLLMQLDDKQISDWLAEATDDRAEARARLDIEQSNLEKLKKDPLPSELRHAAIRLQEAQVQLQRTKENLTRIEQLFHKGLISSEELEGARSEHKLAELSLKIATHNLAIVDSGLEESILEQAQARIELLKKTAAAKEDQIARLRGNLARTGITSSAAGKVVRVTKRDGEAVEAGELVVVISTNDKFRIIASVPERFAAKLQEGQPAEIYSSQFNYRTYGICEGRVDKIDTWAEEVSSGRGGSSAYQVELAVTHAPYQPRMNSRAEARIIVGRKRLIKFLLGWD